MKKILIAIPVIYLTISLVCFLHLGNLDTGRDHLSRLGWKPTVADGVVGLIVEHAGNHPNRYTLGDHLKNELRYKVSQSGGNEIARGALEICDQLLLNCDGATGEWNRRAKEPF